MNKYTLTGIYQNIGFVETCEHCGRQIKNVAVLRNNENRKTIKVGTTCVEKLIELPLFMNDIMKQYLKQLKTIENLKSHNSDGALNKSIAVAESTLNDIKQNLNNIGCSI